jgi:hypothetical protein
VNQPLLGSVCIQLLSLPGGAVGPKYTSTEPSAFVFTVPVSVLKAGSGWSVCKTDRV